MAILKKNLKELKRFNAIKEGEKFITYGIPQQ